MPPYKDKFPSGVGGEGGVVGGAEVIVNAFRVIPDDDGIKKIINAVYSEREMF